MADQFSYAPIYGTEGYEVLFKPDRQRDWKNDEETPHRRFAICRDNEDAKIIVAALNKYTNEGGG